MRSETYNKFTAQIRPILIISILSLAGGALLAALDGLNRFWPGWLVYALPLALAAGGLMAAWRLTGNHPTAGKAALAAFLLRLGVGVALTMLLPIFGYASSEPSRAGYLFDDAWRRDTQAWELAASNESLLTAFDGKHEGDQYGGLLALLAGVYRLISLDAHRPWLAIIFTSAAAGLAVLFLWQAARAWLTEKEAGWASWILALYPESVLLGSNPMREPFVIAGAAMALYAVAVRRRGWGAWLLAAALLLFLIQPPAGVAILIVAAGLWLLQAQDKHSWKPLALFGGVLLAGAVVVYAAWSSLPSLQGANPLTAAFTWFQNNFAFQTHIAERASGMLQKLLGSVGEQWQWLVILVYGAAQPVLPATLVEPAPFIWQAVNFLRALGWYLLVPLLAYAFTAALRVERSRRAQWLWLSVTGWVWIAIAALNAGADMWDNPRYRVILLPFLALLAAWAWGWGRARRDAWLWRWLAADGIFVLLFFEWYLSRYTGGVFFHLDIGVVIAITLSLGALLFGVSWLWDRKKHS